MIVLGVMLLSQRNLLLDNPDLNAVSCLHWGEDYLESAEVYAAGGANNSALE